VVGEDLVEQVNRYLIRRCAAFLDLGLAHAGPHARLL
jgi:uncharacterized protein YbcC (UPF0753/DUF2309 family)